MPTFSSTSTGLLGPAWLEMWALALGIYAVLKLLSWLEASPWRVKPWRSAAYLLAWPGMDARAFLWGAPVCRPQAASWVFATSKLALGVVLVAIAAASWIAPPWLRAWTGMVGIVFMVHFGLFHLLSCLWRTLGIEAVPIMNWPITATSLSEFWSRRWNLAFRDLTHRFVFRPLAARSGGPNALWIGFLMSGIVHDAVISLPARGGYGLPTLFFLIQAGAISLERSRWGKSVGLTRGVVGWLFTAAVLVVPSPLLVHEAFRNNVVLPMLDALTSSFSQSI